MINDDIFNKVSTIIAGVLHIDKSTIMLDSSLDALGADSLDKLEIIMKLEEGFDIEINDEEAEKISSIKEAVERIALLKKTEK